MSNNTSQKSASAKKYGTATGFLAAWGPCLIGLAVAGPFGAIDGALIGNKLARSIDLGDPNGKYTDEKASNH
jgi:hypothetical protein